MLGKQKKKKPNSQWHLAVICASVYRCSSNSDSETLITTMAPVWLTFWRVDLLMCFPLKQVIIAIFLLWLSLLQPLGWQNRQSTSRQSAAAPVKPQCRCSIWTQNHSCSTTHRLSHDPSMVAGSPISWASGVTTIRSHSTGYCLYNVLFIIFLHKFFFFLKCSPTLPWGCPPPTGRKETKHFIYVIYLIYVHSLYFSSVWVSLLLFKVELVSLFCSLFHHWGQVKWG